METADTSQSRDETTTRADRRSTNDMPVSEGRKSQRKRKPGEQATPHKIIEKRRRDRINQSLDELRAILPASKRSQGVRNDKVDLLQMTIDHLKELQQATQVAQNGSQDKHKMSLESIHDVGFTECIKEAKRFLIENEDVNPTDPLLVRLVGHLEDRAKQLCTSSNASDNDPHSPVKRVAAEETVLTDTVYPSPSVSCAAAAVTAGMNLNAGINPLQEMNGLELISSVAESSRLTTSKMRDIVQPVDAAASAETKAMPTGPATTSGTSSVAAPYQGLPVYIPVSVFSPERQAVATQSITATAPSISSIPIALIANAAIAGSQTTPEMPLGVISQGQPAIPGAQIAPKLTQGNYYAYWPQPYVTNAWK